MQADEIFLAAVEKKSPAERAAFLDAACKGDIDLRARVEGLLKSHDAAGSFLDQPLFESTPTLDAPPPSERPGAVIGPYKLLQQIGEGGMGIVWMAEQTQPVQRKVALKVIKPGMDSRQVVARFEAERQALAMMDHVNIARVFDAGTTEAGLPYFVMELVHGIPITKYCDDNHLTPRERLELFVPVCQAIQHAHQKGIIHRDIKPSNVMITLYDGKPVPKVIDFGVAKATEQKLTERTLFTTYGTMVGTLEYMSPEQAEMSALGVDTRSDIYSLGVLLYELLTGSTPLTHKRMKEAAYAEILRMIKEEEPPKPSTRLSDSGEALASISANRHTEPAKLTKLVKGELDWIVMKCLEKDRNRRYATANGFAMDVQRYLADEAVLACPPSVGYRLRKFVRRNKGPVLAASLVLTVLVIGIVGTTRGMIRATHAEADAVRAAGDKTAALATAKANALEADKQAILAKENAKTAKEQELLARRRYYASQMNLAMQAWEAGQAARVLALLESQRPKIDEEDLRSFEWYYLWRLCQGGLRRRFPVVNHDNSAVLALSPDGLTLASGFDNAVKLWDTRTGQEKDTLRGHATQVEQVAITPDGRTLISSDNVTIRTWDLATGTERSVLTPGFLRLGDRFAVAGDGNTLVLGGAKVALWDLSTGRQTSAVTSAGIHPYVQPAIAPDGRTVAGYHKGLLNVWARDGDAWRERPAIHGHGWPYALSFSPDGKVLAAGGWQQLKCYDTATGQLRLNLLGHTVQVMAVNYSADGKAIVSAGDDQTARVWDAGTGRQLACFAHPVAVHGAVLSADGKVAATAGDGIRVWDTAPPEEAVILRHTAAVSALSMSRDGKTLASAGRDSTKLWRLLERNVVKSLPASQRVAISPDGKTLAIHTGKNIELWSVAGERQGMLEGREEYHQSLAFSPDGETLASTFGTEAILWDLRTRKAKATIKLAGTMSAVVFSPDGKTLAAGSQFGVVKLFEAATGLEIATLQRFEFATTFTEALAFSRDSTLLAASNREGLVQVWETATGRLHAALRGHVGTVRGLSFSPDGRTLATASIDRTVKLWDVATGQERCTLKGHQGPVQAVEFTPDGNTLITGSDDGTVRLWPAAIDANARARKAEVEMDVPQTPAALHEQGDALWQYGRTAEAERAYDEAATRLEKLAVAFPDSSGLQQEMIRSLLSRTLLLEQTGRPQEAGPLRERGHQLYRNLSPNDQQALIWRFCERARKLSTGHNKRQAERTYSQAIELAPTNERARSWRSNVYARLGEWDKAVADRSQLIKLNPENASYWSQRGVAYSRLGQQENAIEDFSQAIRLNRSEPVYSDRGSCYVAMGRHAEAVADFSRAIELDPNNPTYHYKFGAALDDLGKAEEALQRYWKAIELNPKDSDVRDNLGKRMLRHRAALDERAAAAPRFPWERGKLASDYFRLAQAFSSLNNPRDAEAACRQALERFVQLEKQWHSTIHFHEEEGWVCHHLASLLHNSGRTEEALPLSRTALEHFRTAALDRPDRFHPREAIAHAAAEHSLFLKQLGKADEAAKAEGEALAARQAAEKLHKLPQAEELLARARPFAEQRRWKQAADELNRGFEGQPRSDLHLCYAAALARLLADDIDGYASLIERMPKRHLSNEWPHDVVRTRSLHPRAAADPDSLVMLAQAAYDWEVSGWSAQNLGLALYRARKFDKALARLEEATRLGEWYIYWPALAMTHHQLGHADEARQWLDKANEHYRHVIETSSEPLKVTKEPYWQDWAYFELLRREANAQPATASHRDLLARTHYDLGEVQRQRGQNEAAEGDFRQAIELWTELTKLNPEEPQNWHMRGLAYFHLQDWDKAIADQTKAIKLSPNVWNYWHHRGVAYAALKEWAKAVADLTKAIDLNPSPLWWNWQQRGLCHAHLADWHRAIQDYDRAIALEPKNAGLQHELAWLLAHCPDQKAHNPKRAVELARCAVGLDPKNGAYRGTLGSALYRAGDWKAAIAEMNLSIKLGRDHGADMLFLAMAHKRLDQDVEARGWYDRAIAWVEKNAPKDDELRRFREEARELLKLKN